VLVAYRLLAPGSEWRLHREWFQRSALASSSVRTGSRLVTEMQQPTSKFLTGNGLRLH
jgi:hypothetical protein